MDFSTAQSVADFFAARPKPEGLAAWVEYADDGASFSLRLAHMSREALDALVSARRVERWEGQTKTREVDTAGLAADLAEHILDWLGMTLVAVMRLTGVSIADVPPEEQEAEVPFSPALAAELMTRKGALALWVAQRVTSFGTFEAALRGREKN